MFGITKNASRQDNTLEFDFDTLENRQMLAADVSVVGGDSLRITGDSADDTIAVSTNAGGTVTVNGISTGLTQLKNLSISTRGGNDTVTVNGSGANALQVTGRTTIRLGSSGANVLNIGGQHNTLRIVGGGQNDRVYATQQIRNAATNVSLKGGNDQFSFDVGMMTNAGDASRVDLARFIAGLSSGQPPKFNVNLGGGNDLVSFSNAGSGQTTSIPTSELSRTDAEILFAGATVNGASGSDTFSPEQLTNTLVTNAFGTAVRRFEVAADLSSDLLPNRLDASQVFNTANYSSIAADVASGQTIQAADTDLLADAMDVLADANSLPGDVNGALANIATARGLSLQQAQAQYERFLQLKGERDSIGQQNQQTPVPDLGFSFDFMGSNVQLRYGKIAGDVLGLDPVFGALLNPTGGLTGPGNLSFNLGDTPLSIHGAVHDAAGYLFNYHNLGPGYNYLGTPDGINDTSDPLAGQINGVEFWYTLIEGDTSNVADAFNTLLSLFTDLVDPVSVTATDSITGFSAANLFSDAQLSAGNYLASASPGGLGNSWVTSAPNGATGDYFANGTANPVLELDLSNFGLDKSFDKVAIWGYSSAAGNDLKSFTLEFSTDGGNTYSNPISLEKSMYSVDNFVTVIDLGGEFEADYVRMTITDNHFETGAGGDRVGFNEIRFVDSSAII
jgi:hypothetical protein